MLIDTHLCAQPYARGNNSCYSAVILVIRLLSLLSGCYHCYPPVILVIHLVVLVIDFPRAFPPYHNPEPDSMAPIFSTATQFAESFSTVVISSGMRIIKQFFPWQRAAFTDPNHRLIFILASQTSTNRSSWRRAATNQISSPIFFG